MNSKKTKKTLDKEVCTSCSSGTLALLTWVELQNRFQDIYFAVQSIDSDTDEHLAYATMDLLTLITEEMNKRIYHYFNRDVVQ